MRSVFVPPGFGPILAHFWLKAGTDPSGPQIWPKMTPKRVKNGHFGGSGGSKMAIFDPPGGVTRPGGYPPKGVKNGHFWPGGVKNGHFDPFWGSKRSGFGYGAGVDLEGGLKTRGFHFRRGPKKQTKQIWSAQILSLSVFLVRAASKTYCFADKIVYFWRSVFSKQSSF